MNTKILTIGSTLMYATIALAFIPTASAGETTCDVEFAMCQCSSEWNAETGEWERCDGMIAQDCVSAFGPTAALMIGFGCDNPFDLPGT